VNFLEAQLAAASTKETGVPYGKPYRTHPVSRL
jgi:hypothetical protein